MGKLCAACKIPNGLVIAGAGKSETLLGPNKVPIDQRFGGYAITRDLDEEVCKAWIEAHYDSQVVTEKLVIFHEHYETLRARVSVLGRIKSGLEAGIRPS